MNMISNLRPNRLASMLGLLLPFAIVVTLAGWLISRPSWSAQPPAPAAYVVPASPAIEEKWGIRINQVAVTASGGLVDLRYTILDSDKAHAMMDSLDTIPKIDVPGKDVTIMLESAPHHHNLIDAGRSSFQLMVNRKGVLHSGDLVTVVIGDLRLEQVPVR